MKTAIHQPAESQEPGGGRGPLEAGPGGGAQEIPHNGARRDFVKCKMLKSSDHTISVLRDVDELLKTQRITGEYEAKKIFAHSLSQNFEAQFQLQIVIFRLHHTDC